MEKTKEHKYLMHLTGFWGMYKYFQSFFKNGYKLDIENNNYIKLSSFYSQHIGIGISKIHSKNPYISVPSEFYKFLNLLSIDNITILKNEQRLIIVTKGLEGDKINWPDLSAIGIGFYFENILKIKLLETAKKIDIKEHYFLANEPEPVISHKTKISSIEVKIYDDINSYDEIIDKKVDTDYYQILNNNLLNTIDKYDTGVEPKFEGTIHKTSDHTYIDQVWNMKYKEIERVKREKEEELKKIKKGQL